MDSYPIYFGQDIIGTATVEKQGLYYKISCHCNCSGEVPIRIVLHCEEMTTDLGMCVPCADGVRSVSRIPIKRIGFGEMTFSAYPRRSSASAKREICICENEPFRYITTLQNAYMIRGGKEAAIGIKDRSQDLPDSDPNP